MSELVSAFAPVFPPPQGADGGLGCDDGIQAERGDAALPHEPRGV